jgi:3-hydroxybutyryl-CoA dehydrogenase
MTDEPGRPGVVAVVGAGTMGAGIAQVALVAGHEVRVYDAAPDAAPRAVRGILGRLDRLVEKGRMTAADRDAAGARLSAVTSLADLAGAELAVEAVVEDLAVKQDLFTALEDLLAPDALLATNTSSLSVTAIGAALERPGRLVGMHFFNPAPLMKLVEVVSGLATDAAAIDRVVALATAWGKTPVRCASTPGFIVNRVARPFYGEALRALEEHIASPATIDAVMRESGGFRMGPFELMDLIGLDVNLAVSTSVWQATGYDARYAPTWTQQEYVAAGWLGRKAGRGFYAYGDDATTRPAPVLAGPEAPPEWVWIRGSKVGGLGPMRQLDELIQDTDIKVRDLGPAVTTAPGYVAGEIRLPHGLLCLTHGRAATDAGDGRILFDLAHDYRTAKLVALAPAADTPPQALREAVGLFQAIGKQVTIVEDVPGMIVAATVARLVNEASDAVYRGDASEDDVDTAMRLGVNYPSGPLEWGERLGALWVRALLRGLAEAHPANRYRLSPLLSRWAAADEAANRLGISVTGDDEAGAAGTADAVGGRASDG